MTAGGSISDSVQPAPASRKRTALRWWFWGVVSAPPTVLLHEFGHFLVFWGLGFPGAVLRYGSADYAASGNFGRAVLEGDLSAAAAAAPVWGVTTGLAMGLVATYVIVLACCFLCAKWKAHPVLVAMGYLSNFRITAALGVLVLPIFGVRIEAGCDECWLERITGIPLAVWALPGVVSLVGAGIFLWKYFPRRNRWVAVTAVVLGMGMGVVFWAGFLGPLVLP